MRCVQSPPTTATDTSVTVDTTRYQVEKGSNGEFRVPTLRNVDERPDPYFVKCYMHNGVFRSLKEVVHFYNTRNLTNRNEILNLTSTTSTAKGHPLWPPPEFASAITMQNPLATPTARPLASAISV
jgi:cytochrome c peroxidase